MVAVAGVVLAVDAAVVVLGVLVGAVLVVVAVAPVLVVAVVLVVAGTVLVTVVWVGLVVVGFTFLLAAEPPKKVVGWPLPVIELPARRSGTVTMPTTIAKATRPVASARPQRGRQSVAGASVWGASGALARPGVGILRAVAVAVRIGRRSVSETSATMTGAAAAPSSVPGPQIRATANDAATDATLAMINVCGEMPLRGRLSLSPVVESEGSTPQPRSWRDDVMFPAVSVGVGERIVP